MPLMGPHYGQNGDEDIEMIYGQDIYKYFTEGDMQATNYDNHRLGMHINGSHMYGSLVPLISEVTHQMFPQFDRVECRHFYSSLLGAVMMIFTGLLAYRLSGRNWWIGLLGFLFILFSPRLFGESMHNCKDIPFAAGVIVSMYFAFTIFIGIKQNALHKYIIYQLIGLTLGMTLTFGSRSGGALLVVAYIIGTWIAFFWFDKAFRAAFKSHQKKNIYAIGIILSMILGFLLALLTWPYGLQGPIHALISSFKEMANRNVDIRVLFEGQYYMNKDMPWYYGFKWIFISSPIFVLVLFVAFVFNALFSFIKNKQIDKALVVFFAIFPIIFIIIRHSTIFDTWRHLFFVFPFWAVGAALYYQNIMNYLHDKKWFKALYIIPVIGLLPEIIWIFTTTPYQYIYFNALVGGIKGANGNYDLDYYQTSNRELGRWIKRNAQKKADGSKVQVYTNMDGNYDHEYMQSDTSWIHVDYKRYYERSTADYDYYLTYNRFLEINHLKNKQFPPCNAVYTIELRGVPIAAILQRKDNSAYLAFEAMNQNNFSDAVKLYEKAFANDGQCDAYEVFYYALALAQSGQMPQAIESMKKAIELDNARPEFYDLLSQLYAAIGDQGNAQLNKNKAQQVKMNR